MSIYSAGVFVSGRTLFAPTKAWNEFCLGREFGFLVKMGPRMGPKGNRNLNLRTGALSLALLVSIDSFGSLHPPLAALSSFTLVAPQGEISSHFIAAKRFKTFCGISIDII